jgi:hypothetical protein
MRRRQREISMEGGPLASSTSHFRVRLWPGGMRLARRVSGLTMTSGARNLLLSIQNMAFYGLQYRMPPSAKGLANATSGLW